MGDNALPENLENQCPEIQTKLSSVQSTLDDLVDGQEKIYSALQTILNADSFKHLSDIATHPTKRVSIRPIPSLPRSNSKRKLTFESGELEKVSISGTCSSPSKRLSQGATRHRLQVREYIKDNSQNPSLRTITGGITLPCFTLARELEDGEGDGQAFGSLIFNVLPVMPNSNIAMWNDVASITFLFYDSIMVPFMIAWDTKLEGYFLWSSLVTALFWTLDMLLHFCRAFTQDGRVVHDLRSIMCHYLKRRFVLDAIVVSFDWLGIVYELSGARTMKGNLSFIKFVRLMKASRLFRIYAMMRTNRYVVIKEIMKRKAELKGLDVQAVFLAMLLKLSVMILWLNHIASCIWIAIETSHATDQDSDRSMQQSVAELHEGRSFDDAGLSHTYLYCFAYYWALTTMFSGASFLVPMTTVECIFASWYVLFGFSVASSVISSMATNLIAGHQANYEKKDKLHKLKQYLVQHKIEPFLSTLISTQLLERFSFQRRVVASDVSLLKFLSAELREKLEVQMWTPVFARQPIWQTCAYLDNCVINFVIRSATASCTAAPGEILFNSGSPVEQMYFLLYGSMQYTLHMQRIWDTVDTSLDVTAQKSTKSVFSDTQTHDDSNCVDGQQKTMVFPTKPICEIALWVEWTSVGLLEAVDYSELLALSVEEFVKLVDASAMRVKNVIKSYAISLVTCITSENPSGLTDLATGDHDAVVPLMARDDRVTMSLPALLALKKEGHLSAELRSEVLSGKCNLRINEAGAIVRVVKLVVLRLQRADGRICVSLGSSVGNETEKVDFKLPGVKQQSQETIGASIDRLIQNCFGDKECEVCLDRVTSDVEEKPSMAYGIPTKYIRTICRARLVSSDDLTDGCQEVSWSEGNAVCFSTKATIDTALDTQTFEDQLKERAFAWMHEMEFRKLVKMGTDADCLVSEWIHGLANNSEWGDTLGEGSRCCLPHPAPFERLQPSLLPPMIDSTADLHACDANFTTEDIEIMWL